MKIHILILALLISSSIFAQKYNFKTIKDIEASNVKSQGRTGTCWSFSTSSFIESEIYRKTKQMVDVSEMFTVRNTYDDKAWNYVMRQGKIQFSEGGLAHDVINSIRDNGLVTEQAFSGLKDGQKIYNHSEIIKKIKPILDDYIKNGKNSEHPNWKKDVAKILDAEIGEIPMDFMFDGKKFTPKQFAVKMKFNPKEYITLTSFSHVPFNEKFVLNIPDNFSSGSMYNLDIDTLIKVMVNAINKGYTIALDVDVSEKTFNAKSGIAVLPKSAEENTISLTQIVEEKEVSQAYRQQEFENYDTTDDHLMHIIGTVVDQKNNLYFKVKNSWGEKMGNGGYVYMSIPYLRLKMISILLSKEAVGKGVLDNLNL